MPEVTVKNCDDVDELVMSYAYGSKLSPEERSRVEEHVKGCDSCSELVFFVQKTMALARKEPISFEPPTEPCLAADTLIALEDNTLDVETARKAKHHLLACPDCREVFLKLRNLSEHRVEERVIEYMDAPRFTDVVVRIVEKLKGALETARERVLELVNISGAGHVLQPGVVAILGESADSSRTITIEDTVKDEETEATASVDVNVGIDQQHATATIHLASRPPQKDWTVSLATLDGNELMRAPLVSEETILGSELAEPSYVIAIRKGEKPLACFSVELRKA